MVYNIGDYIRNKYFDDLKDDSAYIRQAKLFQKITAEMPLFIRDTDYIAGWHGYENDIDLPTTQSKTFLYNHVLDSAQRRLREHLSCDLKINVSFTKAHTCIDYGTIVECGLTHYLTLVEDALHTEPDNDCLRAMRLSLNAAVAYAERFAMLAREKAEKENDCGQKQRFGRMHTALCRVPRFGARDFLEAVQSVWLIHSLIPMAEMSWASISIGRLDQYLYPFYQKFMAEGGNVKEAKAILKNLFLLLDTYGDGACALNIGGMDDMGNHLINELSYLLLEVEKEMLLRAPIFAVRVTPNIPEVFLDALIDFNLFKIGQPTFYNELSCRNAMLKRGLPNDESVNFSVNSCMGLISAGAEFADMWGIKFNSHLPLELAINKGKPLNCNIDFDLSTKPEEITDFEQLLVQYEHYFSELIEICACLHTAVALEAEANAPDPFLSAFINGCIENRCDRSTGAKYNTVTVETMGLINTCDALMAIKELVFDKRKYTLNELITAAKADYAGYEKLQSEISKCRKYGMNDPDVNAVCKRISKTVSVVCKKLYHENRLFLPSLHTIDTNVGYGSALYATLDGRSAGKPVNKNANPSLLLKKTEPTSVIFSAAAIDQTGFSGGQPIDLYFNKTWFDTKESRDRIKKLIRTYFELGGLQLQVNSVDVELLKKAHRQPEDYPDVIVRKGGYSVRFNEMREQVREDFIELVSCLE